MSYWAETGHQLQGAPRPLKPGQQHCPLCEGYGYSPRSKNDPPGSKAIRCDWCDGSGLRAEGY